MTARTFNFKVDTGLFRELGELLVGRDSTALMELVKNAYDADATQVTLTATGLSKPGGSIVVTDNGVGMTLANFESGFLTIAGRNRLAGTRRSKKHGRRFSGAKGVGRLAAHKLSSLLKVESQAEPPTSGAPWPKHVSALIDWTQVETFETIEAVSRGITVSDSAPQKPAGTTIELARLRRRWSQAEIGRFLAEVEGFRLPALLVGNPAELLGAIAPLFDEPVVATRKASDPGFTLVTDGDFAQGDDFWAELGEQMNWLIEIDATKPLVTVAITPTKRLVGSSTAEPRRVKATFKNPRGTRGPFFQARVFIREQAIRGTLRDFARRSSGIRVYNEGFRVLPYGEQTDDWLGLDREYVSKPRVFGNYAKSSDEELEERENEGYYSLGNPQYFGAVFLNQRRDDGLEMVVSREGFVPNESFEAVRTIVQNAIHLSVRARAALGAKEKSAKSAGGTRRDGQGPTPAATDDSIKQARALADAIARRPSGDPLAAKEAVELATITLDVVDQLGRLRDQQALMRVLASVGSELAAFVHELNGILSQAQTVRMLVGLTNDDSSGDQQVEKSLVAAVDELIELLGRQSAYIVDVLGVDARGRRSGQTVHKRLTPVLKSLAPAAEARRVNLELVVDETVKTPSMFPAEVTVLLRNLLTNAIKASGTPGKIRIEVSQDATGSGVIIKVQNTGRRVDLKESERWFQPFESTTTEVDPLLGQGMGLGLTIVRATVDDYGGTVRFVPPEGPFRTAVELRLPRKTGTQGTR